MSSAGEWVNAYARQAEADFATWNHLQMDRSVAECQKLLFLQMACEKLTKAHLCNQGKNPADLQSSHAYVAKNLPIILREKLLQAGAKRKSIAATARRMKHLAQEIELLAPAARRGGQRPDNCEYPWEDAAGELHVPLDWAFTPSELLIKPAGRTFLKLIGVAIRSLK